MHECVRAFMRPVTGMAPCIQLGSLGLDNVMQLLGFGTWASPIFSATLETLSVVCDLAGTCCASASPPTASPKTPRRSSAGSWRTRGPAGTKRKCCGPLRRRGCSQVARRQRVMRPLYGVGKLLSAFSRSDLLVAWPRASAMERGTVRTRCADSCCGKCLGQRSTFGPAPTCSGL